MEPKEKLSERNNLSVQNYRSQDFTSGLNLEQGYWIATDSMNIFESGKHLLRHSTQGHGCTLAIHKKARQNVHKVFLFA